MAMEGAEVKVALVVVLAMERMGRERPTKPLPLGGGGVAAMVTLRTCGDLEPCVVSAAPRVVEEARLVTGGGAR